MSLNIKKYSTFVFLAVLASGCVVVPSVDGPDKNAKLVTGPAITDIVTPFDNALMCLSGKIKPTLTFSVGSVLDQTGKEQYTEGGSGKFITQGAGDIVQSALYRTGATVLNRRDPRILETEVKWGVVNPKNIVPSTFFITGSINSLDFIPGGGLDVSIAGVGPRYREHRILVGLDLTMTETKTGRVIANVPLQKQIFANDAAFGIGRFFGDTLVTAEIGNKQREAVHFALRQMLNLATFELLTQVMHPKNYSSCRDQVDRSYGVLEHTPTAQAIKQYLQTQSAIPNGAGQLDSMASDVISDVGNSITQAGEVVPDSSDAEKDTGSNLDASDFGDPAGALSDDQKRRVILNER